METSSEQPQLSMQDLIDHICLQAQQIADLQARPPIQIDAAMLAASFPAPIVNVAARTTGAATVLRPQTIRFDHDVEPFDGKAASLESFLFNVQLRIDAQAAQLTDDETKVKFFASNLGKGPGWSYYQGLRVQKDPSLADFDLFVKNFKTHFADANLIETMDAKLENLKQSGNVSNYAARFNEYASYVDLSEFSKCKMFFNGLKQEIKEVFRNIDRPAKLHDLQKAATSAEARIRSVDSHSKTEGKSNGSKNSSNSQNSSNNSNRNASNQRGGSSSSSWRSQPATSSQTSSSTSSNANDTVSLPTDTPMQIAAVKMSKLSPADRLKEKARRLAHNLCFWCGSKDHKIQDCPTAPNDVKNKSRVRIAATNDANSGKASPKA